jgi:cell division protein FtsI (penicillin-binding protein 3)
VVCSVWLLLSAVAVASFPSHVREWQEARSSQGTWHWLADKLELADRSGQHLLAQNVEAYDVWLRPSEFWAASWANPKSGGEDAGGLSDWARETALLDALSPWPQAVGVARYRLGQMERSAEGPKLLLWAQPKVVADALMARLTAVGVTGVEVKARMARHYPQGALTAHAVGFTSLSVGNHGQEGLEMLLDRRLTYLKPGRQDPAPLRTTLDLETQRLADGALRAAMHAHGASTGSVMVVDAASGGVRALVSAPGFDPNDAGTFRNPYQPERMLNQATARPVALGGLLTPLLVADLLQRGDLKADAVVDLGHAQGLTVAGVQVRDVQPQPQATLAEIVARSSNVGQAKLALRITRVQLQALLKGAGLHGDSGMSGLVGVDFVKPDWNAWTAGLQATAGQNLISTMMRVVQAYMPIANGGTRTRLTLVSDDEDPKKVNLRDTPRVLSEQTACEVRRMLHQATGVTGTAPLAMVTGVSVAGKTATNTHLPVWEEGKGMRHVPQADAMFVGMFPAERPQYVIGVQLGFADTKPRFAGAVAAPVFAQVVRGMVAQGAVQMVLAQASCAMPLEAAKHEEALR